MRHNSKLEQPIKRLKIGANLELRLKNAISPCLVLKKYKTCLNEIRDFNTALIEIHLPRPLFYSLKEITITLILARQAVTSRIWKLVIKLVSE